MDKELEKIERNNPEKDNHIDNQKKQKAKLDLNSESDSNIVESVLNGFGSFFTGLISSEGIKKLENDNRHDCDGQHDIKIRK